MQSFNRPLGRSLWPYLLLLFFLTTFLSLQTSKKRVGCMINFLVIVTFGSSSLTQFFTNKLFRLHFNFSIRWAKLTGKKTIEENIFLGWTHRKNLENFFVRKWMYYLSTIHGCIVSITTAAAKFRQKATNWLSSVFCRIDSVTYFINSSGQKCVLLQVVRTSFFIFWFLGNLGSLLAANSFFRR